MTRQAPSGPDHLYCPFWRKPMAKVCHTCPMWIKVRGMNRNTGEEVDEWRCSFSVLPALMVENANQSREAGAAIESFRNAMVNQQAQAVQVIAGVVREAEQRRKMVGLGDPPPRLLKEEDDDGSR